MKPLQITAHLATPIAIYDDWSPSMDALLTWLILDELGLAAPNPTTEEIRQNHKIICERMPLKMGYIQKDWYWQVSSPHYQYSHTINDVFYKRWDCQEQHLDWGKKKAKWSSQEGHTKSWTVDLRLRNPARIDWFCVGDRAELQRLLNFCQTLGKKDRGQVWGWQVEPSEDYHLTGTDKQLMRPIPCGGLPPSFKRLRWGWRPPVFLPENVTDCWMPIANVGRLD